MLRGIRPPVSVQKRAGLQKPLHQVSVTWDGKVPAEHATAFAHKLRRPDGREVMARWYAEQLFAAGGGHWVIESKEDAGMPAALSRDGWGYVGPLLDGAARADGAHA